MASNKKPKGLWIHRFFIYLFTVIFAILIFWLQGFLLKDIESIKGPEYYEIEKKHVDQHLITKSKDLQAQIRELDRRIANKVEEMRIVSDNSQNLQKTINQLIELQRLTLQKSVVLPEAEQGNLSAGLSHFLESQRKYQALNTDLSRLTDRKMKLEEEQSAVEAQIVRQRKPVHEEYQLLNKRHKLRLAYLQLMTLIPLLAAGAFFIMKKRDNMYFPIFFGFGAATLLKVALVIHKYFPTRYLKYILILGLLVVVIKLLIHFIRIVAYPKTQWLSRQYREAYERFLCPVCEFPIRTGPRKYLYWTRRTVNRNILPKGNDEAEEEPYSCPSCSTNLFETCSSCNKIRYSLLPNCHHCNAQKEIRYACKNRSKTTGQIVTPDYKADIELK